MQSLSLIFAIPTWDFGELQEDCEDVWPHLHDLNLSHATVALYGQGDQEGYPEWFLDAMGFLYHKLKNAGASIVGYWPVEGYRFNDSKALTADKSHFVGLALDDETQFDHSQVRIQLWCKELKMAFQLL